MALTRVRKATFFNRIGGFFFFERPLGGFKGFRRGSIEEGAFGKNLGAQRKGLGDNSDFWGTRELLKRALMVEGCTALPQKEYGGFREVFKDLVLLKNGGIFPGRASFLGAKGFPPLSKFFRPGQEGGGQIYFLLGPVFSGAFVKQRGALNFSEGLFTRGVGRRVLQL